MITTANPCYAPIGEDPADPITDHQAFPLLADASSYNACLWDLRHLENPRAYWLDLFRRHFASLLDHARSERLESGEPPDQVEGRCQQASTHFLAWLDHAEDSPSHFDRLDVLTICWARERALRAAGIADPYRLAKAEQTDAALIHLPGWLTELDAMDRDDKWLSLLRGVFAGNLFDLGATKTLDMYADGSAPDFRTTLNNLKPRPWFIDGGDAFLARWSGRRFCQAVLFIDNAGPDVTLGMIPLARELARYGRVILSANSAPSLNDITHAELLPLLDQVARLDPTIAEQRASDRLVAIPSGNWAPLMDLTRMAPDLCAAADRGTDLVILEGMGRGVESNYEAQLTCDTLKIAMIKDEGVAEAQGASLFDLVCRFDPATD
ncbi:MAG: ARMT1-like domain-containing protein [Phycisphaeraceae bacterium]